MIIPGLQAILDTGKPPRDLIDHNVRIDYGKLRHLVQIDAQLNGNFSNLREIIACARTTQHEVNLLDMLKAA